MVEHLARAYGTAQQAAEIGSTDLRTWIVAQEDGDLVAFAQLRLHASNAVAGGARPAEIWRFYLARTWHGAGLAPRLMAQLLDDARAHDADHVWLGVWEHNPRAIAFYRKLGFREVGEHVFLLGRDPQRDIVMALFLPT